MKSAFSYFASFYYLYIPKILNHMTILLTNFYQFPMIFCSMPHMESTESDHKTLNGKLHGTLWKQTKGRPMPLRTGLDAYSILTCWPQCQLLVRIESSLTQYTPYRITSPFSVANFLLACDGKGRGDPIDYSSPLCQVVKPFKYFKEMSF